MPAGASFAEGTLLDRAAIAAVLRKHAVTGVVHLAALKYAGVSVQQPLEFYDVNVTGTVRLLEAMGAAGIRPDRVLLQRRGLRHARTSTWSPRRRRRLRRARTARRKLIGEWLLRDVARIRGLRHTSLRYFNVVGSGHPAVYDTSPHNLFPLVLSALTEGRRPKVFGADYPTPDGSCVRDYIHVADVADAHVAAAARLEEGAELAPAYNLGLGTGISVLEILDAMRRVLGKDFEHELADRRPGDPARIVTSADKARTDLGWSARYDLEEMVRSSWQAWSSATR